MKRIILLTIILSVLGGCVLLNNKKKNIKNPHFGLNDVNPKPKDSLVAEHPLEIHPDKMIANEGIGLGNIGTIGHGAGNGQGFGNGHGRLDSYNVNTVYITDTLSINASISDYGVITYFVPDTMEITKPYIIKLRIARQYSEQVTKNINSKQSGTVVVDKVKVSNRMKAVLRDIDGSFTIKVLATEVQSISKNKEEYTQWQWSIIPNKGGDHELNLSVSITGKVVKDYEVYDGSVHVHVPFTYPIIVWLKSYWQWLCTTIIIPLIVWWWKKRNKKSEEKEESEEKES